MMSREWQIVDRYRNTTRDQMPLDETITSFADRLVELAEKVILEQGGERVHVRGRPVYRIPHEEAASVYPLSEVETEKDRMRAELRGSIESSIQKAETRQEQARGAYLAISLDLTGALSAADPGAWQRAVEALGDYPQVLESLYDREPGTPGQKALQARATAAGLEPPATKAGP